MTRYLVAGFLGGVVLASPLGAQTPAAPRVRDSGGVRIIEHATIRTTRVAFTIAVQPTLALGGLRDDEREEFDSRNPFATAVRLSDGRIVATDYASYKLLDQRGRFIRSAGRSGPGPGEFRQLYALCVIRGDTVIAMNYGDGRTSVFDSAGKHVRSFVVAGAYPATGPCLADGVVLNQSVRVNPLTRMTPERASILDLVATAVRVGTDGVVRDTIGVFPTETAQITIQSTGNVFARGSEVYVGDGRTTEIFVYSVAGRLTRIIRWRDQQTRVTDAMIDELVARNIPTNVTGERREQQLAMLRSRPMPEFLPAYSHVIADPAGRIWVQDHYTTPAPRNWTVFGADGTLLGHVALPAIPGVRGRVDIKSIGQDHVVLAWRDEADGALHITFHPLAAPLR